MDCKYSTSGQGYSRTGTMDGTVQFTPTRANGRRTATVHVDGRSAARRSKRVPNPEEANVGTQTTDLDENRKTVATRQRARRKGRERKHGKRHTKMADTERKTRNGCSCTLNDVTGAGK